jgi:hypothetical protein
MRRRLVLSGLQDGTAPDAKSRVAFMPVKNRSQKLQLVICNLVEYDLL